MKKPKPAPLTDFQRVFPLNPRNASASASRPLFKDQVHANSLVMSGVTPRPEPVLPVLNSETAAQSPTKGIK